MCITNSQLFPIPPDEYDVKQKEIQYCVRAGMDYRTGLPGQSLCVKSLLLTSLACLFLDFVFVNISGGLNVSLICSWKRCILLHVPTHGFIIRPCVRVHSNNTLQHETLNHSKQYTFADINKMLFVFT